MMRERERGIFCMIFDDCGVVVYIVLPYYADKPKNLINKVLFIFIYVKTHTYNIYVYIELKL